MYPRDSPKSEAKRSLEAQEADTQRAESLDRKMRLGQAAAFSRELHGARETLSQELELNDPPPPGPYPGASVHHLRVSQSRESSGGQAIGSSAGGSPQPTGPDVVVALPLWGKHPLTSPFWP